MVTSGIAVQTSTSVSVRVDDHYPSRPMGSAGYGNGANNQHNLDGGHHIIGGNIIDDGFLDQRRSRAGG